MSSEPAFFASNARPGESIRQTRGALPDFRSLGVITRVLLVANAAGLLAAALRSERLPEIPDRFVRIAVTLEPTLLCALTLLYLAGGLLARLSYPVGLGAVLALAAVLAAAMSSVTSAFGQTSSAAEGMWNAGYAIALAGFLAGYFNLRERAFSPALAEARLQALQARIRPHFLFNCLNAVLVLIRRDPKRAEGALEDMADLFRNVMSDNRELVTLADEIALTRQYLQLEHLRLGDRLVVNWTIDEQVRMTLVPPMLLQPLVENAVYHGVEPGLEPGIIDISAQREGDRLRLVLSNPYHAEHQHRQGNRMALANIEERLALHFDIEASLETGIVGERFRILIRMPLKTARAGR
jgi:two-component system sensor histidine kinase AlgZ